MIVVADIATFSDNGIFSPFKSQECNDIFKAYFYRSLNPDYAPVGFLETLDHLLQIAKIRPVIIATGGSDKEMEYAKVLEEFLMEESSRIIYMGG